MTKRFLISVTTATLIAGTGFANAQGTGGRESPSGGGATQQGDATEQKSDMKSEQKSMGAEKSQRTEDRMQTQTQGGAAGQSTTTTGQAGAAGRLSTEQRTQITSVIKEQHVAPVTNVNSSISVGTKVPRDVTFHTLPERVVTIYPEWRRYKFILVKEQIVIVDPDTYEIVAVLES